MAKIKILSDLIANKIAAGEVIGRPASVIKELVENSIDAGATSIVVDVEAAGRRVIRVSDNGSGMSREDALLSLERHSTSKISSVQDIDNITTLGFRGEALPSISSVSKTTIETKTKEEPFGTRIVIDGGIIKTVTEVGRDKGTLIEVKNLFFNVPARRKFLSAENTEIRHIKLFCYDIVISSPEISLTLNSGGKELFSFNGSTNRTDVLKQVFGGSVTELMVPVSFTAEGVNVEGVVGKPETARNSGAHQFVIINGRPISSRSISRAIFEGYGHTLAKGMYPAFALYFQIDPSRIDVNVHPSKREIRIHREFPILQALRENIAGTIQSMAAVPNLQTYSGPIVDFNSTVRPITIYNPPSDMWKEDVRQNAVRPPANVQGDTSEVQSTLEFSDTVRQGFTPGIVRDAKPYEGPVFWQLKDKYIITTIQEGALIIDQHVAHERILLEELLEHFNGRSASAQQLLFPVVLDFSAPDYDFLEPMIPFLTQIGFGIREFGERSVMIDAVPAWQAQFDEGEILNEYIDEMRVHGKITSGYIDKLATAVACRSAIKAGKPLSQEEMRSIVDRLFATKSPFVCPHGRPTIIKLSLDELDRRFGR